jgi:hypothetical protein
LFVNGQTMIQVVEAVTQLGERLGFGTRACHLIEPDDGSSEVDGSEEVFSCFVVASGDAAEELEFGEEVLDQVSSFKEFLVIFSLHFSIGSRRDDGLFPGIFQRFQHPFIGIEALVGNHRPGFQQRQHIGSIQFAGLAFGETKANRVAARIDGGMNLGAQPALAGSDGLRTALFLRAPALCW